MKRFLKYFACLAVLAIPVGCEQGPTLSADGYAMGKGTLDRSEFTVTVVEYRNRAAMLAAGHRYLPKDAKGVQAWGTVRKSRPACTIHVVDLDKTYSPEWLGHELAHCMKGEWHR